MCAHCTQYRDFIDRYQQLLCGRSGHGKFAYVNLHLQQALLEHLANGGSCYREQCYPQEVWRRVATFEQRLQGFGLQLEDWFRAVRDEVMGLL